MPELKKPSTIPVGDDEDATTPAPNEIITSSARTPSTTLTLASLFDGAGTIPLAAEMVGITTLWSSEIEKFPREVTAKRFPTVAQLGDVTRINGAEVAPVDVIAGGSPCFPAGTLVLAEGGYVPIEVVKEGDLVCTHRGRWRKVEAVGSKEAPTVELRGGHYGLVCTPEHPFYARTAESVEAVQKGEGERAENAPTWMAASDMEGNYFGAVRKIDGLPIPPMESLPNGPPPLPLTEELMYVVGRWLADGWVNTYHRQGRGPLSFTHRIIICCNRSKRDELARRLHDLLGGVCKVGENHERTAIKFSFHHGGFCRWLTDNFGRYAHGKRIAGWVFGLERPLLAALLEGYLSGDGHHFADQKLFTATTVSKALACGIRTVGEILGYSCGLSCTKTSPTHTIEGRTVSQRDSYTVRLSYSPLRKSVVDSAYNWYRCRSVRHCAESTTVYNIAVADDHSFVVDGYAVHNCQDLSMAGQRAGLAGTKSSLFFEQIRIIKEMRNETVKRAAGHIQPRYVVFENVPGLLNSNNGNDFRTVLEEFCRVVDEGAAVPRPPQGKWRNSGCIVGDGYSVAWRVLDAQYWGVPQRRRRIWLVADFGGGRAPSILFERAGLSGRSAESRAEGKNTADGAAKST